MRKLQINDSGAWRQVLTYKDKRDAAVRQSAALMVGVANPAAKLRVVDADTGGVLLYWGSGTGWHEPGFVAARRMRP